MADIFREVDEELRQENVQRLWRRYGTVIIAAAVVLVLATAGYTAWTRYQTAQRIEATEQLAATLNLADPQTQPAPDALAAFAAQYDGPQAALARIHEAGLRAEQGDRQAAVAILRQVAADAREVPAAREAALLLAIHHQIDTAEPGPLQAELAPLTVETSPWRYSALELSALLSLRAGDRVAARTTFERLAADPLAPEGVRSRAAELSLALAE